MQAACSAKPSALWSYPLRSKTVPLASRLLENSGCGAVFSARRGCAGVRPFVMRISIETALQSSKSADESNYDDVSMSDVTALGRARSVSVSLGEFLNRLSIALLNLRFAPVTVVEPL